MVHTLWDTLHTQQLGTIKTPIYPKKHLAF